MKALFLVFVSGALLGGCGTIHSHNQLDQPQGEYLTASIGSVIFRVTKSSDLPNAVGGADIFGGKVARGFTEMRLKGIQGTKLQLQVLDANTNSTETTMDRYGNRPRVDVRNQISIGNNTPGDTTSFIFDMNDEKELVVSGVKVTFVQASKYSIKYHLQQAR
jgi:hypothetical protein